MLYKHMIDQNESFFLGFFYILFIYLFFRKEKKKKNLYLHLLLYFFKFKNMKQTHLPKYDLLISINT